ncbi:MAG: xylulokinase [Chloroflexia bacterium]|nr:xylulokinase [Chloroflexia bacterium]
MSRSPRPGVLAIDLGTSSVKALVVDQRGEIAGRGGATYPTHHPSPGFDEQEVDDWLDATITATSAARRFAPDVEIHAVSVTGQMHGTVLFDEHNQALGRAIVWSDRRAVDDLETLEQSLPADLRRRIGGPLATGYQIASLHWLRQHQQRVWSRIRKILLPKDALILLLTGIAATDPSDAVSTGLFDAERGQWDSSILDALELNPDWLPPILPSGTPIVPLAAAAAGALGIPAGIPVIVAGGDAPVAAVGTGVTSARSALVVLSTGAQIVRPTSSYTPDPDGRWHTWPAAVPGGGGDTGWNRVGAVLNSGRAVNWLHGLIGGSGTVRELVDTAALAPPGAYGLLFLPYLAGERSPILDPHARGAFMGLTARHGPEHLTRAVLEGVTFSIADAMDRFSREDAPPTMIHLGGGGSSAPIWRQIIGDVIGAPIQTSDLTDTSAFGAARIAAHTLGWITLPDDHEWLPRRTTVVTPNRERAALYREILPIYRNLASAVLPLTHELARVTSG